MAPEALCFEVLSEKSDVWSMAVVIFALLAGTLPFEGESVEEIQQSMNQMNWQKEFKKAKWDNVSDLAKHFLLVCFQKNYEQRPSSTDLLTHPWLESVDIDEIAPGAGIVAGNTLSEINSRIAPASV